jgi:hypothetical protein
MKKKIIMYFILMNTLEIIREKYLEKYEINNKIKQIDKEIRNLKLKLYDECNHEWEYDYTESFDSICKYNCKICNLPKNKNCI